MTQIKIDLTAFCEFDLLLISQFNEKVTKIETVQNCYIAVSGCPGRLPDHTLLCLQAALKVGFMLRCCCEICTWEWVWPSKSSTFVCNHPLFPTPHSLAPSPSLPLFSDLWCRIYGQGEVLRYPLRDNTGCTISLHAAKEYSLYSGAASQGKAWFPSSWYEQLQELAERIIRPDGQPSALRIGIHAGPLVAGAPPTFHTLFGTHRHV